MNKLLPKSEGDFSEASYWENFFKARSNSFEWYGEYTSLIDLFLKYVQKKDNVLVVGCGNSTLSEDLYFRHKCNKVISVDTSITAINQMLLKNKKHISSINSNLESTFDFICMDASKLSEYEIINSKTQLSCIIDKGTTDAIHSGGSTSFEIIESMWSAIDQSLETMGRYVLITLAQEHIVESIVSYFTSDKKSHGWMINVHELAQSQDSNDTFKLPIFAFIFYKMKYSPSLPLVYVEENSFSVNKDVSQKKLLKNPKTDLCQWVLSRQRLSMLCNTIKKSDRKESEIDMVSPETGLTRYRCILVNNASNNKRQKKNNGGLVYCVFIIPFGHERSPLYNGEKERLRLCKDHLKCKQCLFVYLNPREYYASKQAIQDELHSVSLKFCPVDAPTNFSIPVISSSEQVCSTTTSHIGSLILETVDISSGKCNSRRLICPSSSKPVLMSTSPLSIKDTLIHSWITNIPAIITTTYAKSLFIGRPGCTNAFDNQWTVISSPEYLSDIMAFSAGAFGVCSVKDVNKVGVQDCVVCDVTMDKEFLSFASDMIENTNIMIIVSTTDTLTEPLLQFVRYQCQTSDQFDGEIIYFSVLSKASVDFSLLESTFKQICADK